MLVKAAEANAVSGDPMPHDRANLSKILRKCGRSGSRYSPLKWARLAKGMLRPLSDLLRTEGQHDAAGIIEAIDLRLWPAKDGESSDVESGIAAAELYAAWLASVPEQAITPDDLIDPTATGHYRIMGADGSSPESVPACGVALNMVIRAAQLRVDEAIKAAWSGESYVVSIPDALVLHEDSVVAVVTVRGNGTSRTRRV